MRSTACHSASSTACGSAKRAKAPACWANALGSRPPPVRSLLFRAVRNSCKQRSRNSAPSVERRVGVEEGPDLLAERLVVAAGENDLAAVPEGIAGQGDFEGFPGAFVGGFQGVGEFSCCGR